MQKIDKEALECAVYLNKFEDDEMLCLIPKCDHVFHAACIDAWLESHTTFHVLSSWSKLNPLHLLSKFFLASHQIVVLFCLSREGENGVILKLIPSLGKLTLAFLPRILRASLSSAHTASSAVLKETSRQDKKSVSTSVKEAWRKCSWVPLY